MAVSGYGEHLISFWLYIGELISLGEVVKGVLRCGWKLILNREWEFEC